MSRDQAAHHSTAAALEEMENERRAARRKEGQEVAPISSASCRRCLPQPALPSFSRPCNLPSLPAGSAHQQVFGASCLLLPDLLAVLLAHQCLLFDMRSTMQNIITTTTTTYGEYSPQWVL